MYSKTTNCFEIVTPLADRNKNLWWADRLKLHYQEARLVISLAAAVRGIHSTTAPVPNDISSLHLQQHKDTLTPLCGLTLLDYLAISSFLSVCLTNTS